MNDELDIQNLKKITDHKLHLNLKELVKKEKDLLTQVLHHLKEVDRRKLFSDFKCRSLFDYCVKILNYSESEAYTRINSMRLLKEFPEIESSIKSGSLSLTNLAQAQSYFKKETNESKKPISVIQKKEILENVKNSSTRETKGYLLSLSKTPHIHKESKRTVSSEHIELKLTLNNEVFNKLEALKIKHHAHSYEELINILCDNDSKGQKLNLKKTGFKVATRNQNGHCQTIKDGEISKAEESTKDLRTRMNCESTIDLFSNKAFAPLKSCIKSHKNLNLNKKKLTLRKVNSTLTLKTKRLVKSRDQNKCCNCGTSYDLQIDHIKPQSLGGTHSLDNLQTLCRPCNLRRAVKTFGADKMERFQKL